MSRLEDNLHRLLELTEKLKKVDGEYREYRTLLASCNSDSVNTVDVKLQLVTGDRVTPLPIEMTSEQLSIYIGYVANNIGMDLVRLWRDIFSVAEDAKGCCDAAERQVQMQEANVQAHAETIAPEEQLAAQPTQNAVTSIPTLRPLLNTTPVAESKSR